jgi:CO/xanthine dehydrogenase Mo-binding subunit/CO/xanthine dehydrogenase FAD-binding subunit
VTIAPEQRDTQPLEARLGARVPNLEWSEKTNGAAVYADDVKPAGLLHAAVLRSHLPHARIVRLDAARALAAAGVVGVLTPDDLPDRKYIHHGGHLSDRGVLARGVVRFIGEEIAAVAAETPEQARAALREFDLKLKRLRAATTVDAARRPNAPLIHADAAGNVSLAFSQDLGERPAAGQDTVTVEGTFTFPRNNHACMETNSIVAHWQAESGELHIWVSTQAPYFVEKELANVLELPREKVIVHEVAVGGGFGSKSKISEYEAIAAALSMKTNRPVRLSLTRAEEFTTVKSRHKFEIGLSTTADRDGRLVSRRADIVVDNGAYNHSGPSVMGAGAGALASLYDVPHVGLNASLVYTNTLPGGQFRGYGNPQATFAVESQMDEPAYALGMDPFEFRIRNANRAGQRTHVGYQLGSAALAECLEAARDAIGWSGKKAWSGSGRGVGVAASIQVSGAYVYPGANKTSAALDVSEDGSVLLRFGGADAGTGQRTLLAQVIAEELGVALEAVDVEMMDSVRTPTDMGAWSSRGTYMSGHAARSVVAKCVEALRSRAASAYGKDLDAVSFRAGRIEVAGRSLTVRDLMRETAGQGPLSVECEYTADVEEMDWKSGTGNISGAYSFAAHAVEVEVDRVTGKVRVVDYVAVHDSGRVLNPLLAESQVIGGVVMGIGAALGEELLIEGGRIVNGAYLNYALPRAADVPRVRPIFVPGSDPKAPFGAKGLGEIVLVPCVAAVGNAIAHATGLRLREAPFTPDKVLTAWNAATSRDRKRSFHVWRRPSRWQIAAIRTAYPLGVHATLDKYGTRYARPVEPLPAEDLTSPAELDQALALLATPGSRPLGGGTDLVPGQAAGKQALGRLVDVTLMPGLGRIKITPHGDALIGGAVRLATLAEHEGTDWRGALGATARTIASHQVREMATVAGNLCQEKRCWFYRNGFNCYKRGGATCPCYAVEGDHRFYHAVTDAHRCQAVTPSDLATTLRAMDAEVLVARQGSEPRRLTVAALYDGPGETTLRSDELITDVVVPAAAQRRSYAFEKLNLWTGDFAVVSACASLERDAAGTVSAARLVLGAVAPTPLRLTALERRLVAAPPRTWAELHELCLSWGEKAHPLKNNEWKIDAAAGVLATALARLLDIARD